MKRILVLAVAAALGLSIGAESSEAALRGRVRGIVRSVNVPVVGNLLNRRSGGSGYTVVAEPEAKSEEKKSDDKKAPTPAPKAEEKPAKSG